MTIEVPGERRRGRGALSDSRSDELNPQVGQLTHREFMQLAPYVGGERQLEALIDETQQQRVRALVERRVAATDLAEQEQRERAELQESHRRGDRLSWRTVVGGVVASAVTVIGSFAVYAISEQPPPAPTVNTVSVCVNAQQNVERSLSILKVTNENQLDEVVLRQLETVNSEEVDAQCGEESDVARIILR